MIAKVIATCFRPGREVRVGARHVFPTHQQDCSTPEQVLDMLRNVVELEKKHDAGVPLDVIIVNNDYNFKEGNVYIEELNGTKTKNGTIYAYTRPNIGWSFGAFSDAFIKYHDDYKYWMFTEDDILISGDDYGKKLVERWNELEAVKVPVGYLALVKVVKHVYGIHCGGAIGFTSRQVLDKVLESIGRLPHHQLPERSGESLQTNRQQAILNGEVAFTNKIDELGFLLLDYGENKSWDWRNLCIPYYTYKNVK